MKKLILILFFSGILSSSLYANIVNEVLLYPINYTYVVYYSSLTTANKNTVKNILKNTGGNHFYQPTGRFFEMYNSTRAVAYGVFYTAGDIGFDVTTTRLIIGCDADYDSLIQPWITAGKVKRISSLYYTKYDDTEAKKYGCFGVKIIKYMDYKPDEFNKDWCLFTVDTSTH